MLHNKTFDKAVAGETKVYTHKEYALLDEKTGKIVILRCSFDEERAFIRSIHIWNGKDYVALPISLSDKAWENV